MERRVLLAVVLSFLVLYGYQSFLVPPPPPSTPQQGAGATTQGEASTAPTGTPSAVTAPATPPLPEAVTGESAEREIVVNTGTVEAVLSNRGGRVLHWRLTGYRDDAGRPLDLVPSELPAEQPTPFSLSVPDAQVTSRMNRGLYRVTGDSGGRVDATRAQARLTFEYQDAAGLRVRKTFTFEPRGYVVALAVEANDGSQALSPAVVWGPGLGDVGAASGGGSFFTGNYVQPPEAIYHRDGDVERVSSADVAGAPTYEGQFRFLGIDDHYFLAVLVNPGQARADYRAVTLPGAGGTQRQLLSATYTFPQARQEHRFFFGPKQFDLLRSVDGELVRAINFGMFAFLVVPLLGALTWTYSFVGNYGWAIILLTIFINVAIFPLRHKSVVSMRKMQLLQPQLKAIQDRYAGLKVTDPARQKMNTEIMNLYRERGVNPASGCVPMLLTMPVLFAFYSLLSQAIELRGADFVGWIHDLSQHDPLYITPVLMGASMFWQQKITPTAADPSQQKVMMIMPLMFSFMFLWAPSGLVLYWLVSNVWAIGQQYFTNWWMGPSPMTVPRPPAERRVKSAGGGKTPGAQKGS